MALAPIKLHDKYFVLYLSEQVILDRIAALAMEINRDYKGLSPVIISILNGSFIFTADLVRKLDLPLYIEFVRYSSYHGTSSTGAVSKTLEVKTDIKDRDIIIVEDIIDTGLTINKAIIDLKGYEPASVKVVSLLVKPEAITHEAQIDYVGFEIPNEFVVGYGLDYDELGRDLPAIYRVSDD